MRCVERACCGGVRACVGGAAWCERSEEGGAVSLCSGARRVHSMRATLVALAACHRQCIHRRCLSAARAMVEVTPVDSSSMRSGRCITALSHASAACTPAARLHCSLHCVWMRSACACMQQRGWKRHRACSHAAVAAATTALSAAQLKSFSSLRVRCATPAARLTRSAHCTWKVEAAGNTHC